MKFDWSSCAVGVIAGVGAILSVIFAVQLDIFVKTPICAGDENGLTCARNWVNGVAIAAAAGTVFFLAREQNTARRNRQEDRDQALELYTLQTLPMRAKLGRLRYLVEAMERDRGIIRLAVLALNDIERNTAKIRLLRRRRYPHAIRRLYERVKSDDWAEVQEIDATIAHYRQDLVTAIEMAVDDYLKPGVTMEDFVKATQLRKVLDQNGGPMEGDAYAEEVLRTASRLLSQVEALKIAIEMGVLREHFGTGNSNNA